ncbi:MAG: ParA family protein, partial [Caulobacterales bacterium]|nr:ParA family protein [Caulobacterales bacterium]
LARERQKGTIDLICGQFDIAKYAFLEDRALIDRARDNFVRAIDALRTSYDLIVVDTNPSASFLTKCVLSVSTRVIAPVRPDRFSLRGVRLLNQLIPRLVEVPGRPPISVVFNGVERSSVGEFEHDLRTGGLDMSVGFPLSRHVLKTRLHTSRFLGVREEGMEDDPLQHLAIYRASGIWAGALKDAIHNIADEIAELVDLNARPRVEA